MFSKTKKISKAIQEFIKLDYYKTYRVIIEFKKFHKDFEKTITRLGGRTIHTFDHINLICALLPPRAMYRLVEYPEVSFISLDEYCFLCGVSISNINGLRDGNPSNLRGQNIKIALIDSGTFPHPDLSSSKKIVNFVDLIKDYKYPYDDNGHGTALSTLMCGTGSSSKFKYKGIATEACVISYKCFDDAGRANFSDVLKSLEFVISDQEELETKILCMPFESFNTSARHISYFDKLLDIIISRGIIPVMSSGSNSGRNSVISGLANAKNVILVSGLNNDLSIYKHSCTGNKHRNINIFAKCSNISCGSTDRSFVSQRGESKIYPPKLKEPYQTYSGTSIAAAYICAVCALLLEKYPNYTFNDVVSRIELCTQNIEQENSRDSSIKTLDVEKFLS